MCVVASAGICAIPLAVGGGSLAVARGGALAAGTVVTVGTVSGGILIVGGAAGIANGTGMLFNNSNGGGDAPGSLSRGDMKKLGDKQYEKAMGESAHDFKWDVVGGQVSRWDIYHGKDGMLYLISKDGRVIVPTYKPWKG